MTDSPSSPAASVASAELDEFVEVFESALSTSPSVHFQAFLPPDDHPAFAAVAAEIVRVDLENNWSRGDRSSLESYRASVPALFESRRHLQEVAYEEYRLRRLAGEDIGPADYGTRYGIDTDQWPAIETTAVPTNSRPRQATPERDVHKQLLQTLDAVDGMPQVGCHFDEFELIDELGCGTFARVFLARQGGLANRLVALKVSAGLSGESDRLARLQHTNIVPIYSIHDIDDLSAVCMPYLGSPTLMNLLCLLRQRNAGPSISGHEVATAIEEVGCTPARGTHVRAKKSQPQSEAVREQTQRAEPERDSPAHPSQAFAELHSLSFVEAVTWIISRVADGLAFAHRQGIVHRDLKPANVLLANDGEPRILDFNLSDQINGTAPTTLVVGGTLPYMSPEHLETVRSGGRVGPSSDVFALGVILYELLTFRRPFPDHRDAFDDMVDQMIADRRHQIPSVRDRNRQVPRAVEAIVNKCLHPDPQLRYPSAVELNEDLRQQLDNLPLRHAPDRSPVERVQKWGRRHPRFTSAGTVATIAAMALLVVAVVFVARGHRLAAFQARDTFHEFQSDYSAARVGLSLRATDPSLRQQTLAAGRHTVGIYGTLTHNDWQDTDAYKKLDESRQRQLDQQLSELMYLMAARLCDFGEPSPEDLTEALRANKAAISLLGNRAPNAYSDQRVALLALSGEADAAKTTTAPSVNEGPLPDLDLYLDAVSSLEEHDYSRAMNQLQTLRDANPLDPALWLLAGNAQAGLNELSGAEACHSTCIGLLPKSYVGYFYRGRCRLDQGDLAGALRDFDRVLELQPNLTAALLNRALILRRQHKYAQAEQELTSAIDAGNVSTRAYFLRADTRERLGDTAGAQQDRLEGLERPPTDDLAWVARGAARLKDDPHGALRDFEAALRINRAAHSAARNSVYVLIEVLGNKEKALQQLGRMLEFDPNDKVALAARAVLQARMGRRTESLQDVDTLLRGNPTPKFVFQAACALALTSLVEPNDARRAATLLARSFQRDPTLVKLATSDPDLDPIRTADDFKALIKAAKEINAISVVR